VFFGLEASHSADVNFIVLPLLVVLVTGGLLLPLALGIGPTPWSVLGGAAMVMVVVASAVVAQASLDIWLPYCRITAWTMDVQRISIGSHGAGPPYASAGAPARRRRSSRRRPRDQPVPRASSPTSGAGGCASSDQPCTASQRPPASRTNGKTPTSIDQLMM
jgi:hypothetical protein